MYEDFKTTNRALSCSYDLYRKVLNALNVSFTKLGHEKCGECGIFHEYNKEHCKDNTDPDCQICYDWQNHMHKAKKSRNLYKEHANKKGESKAVYLCADL